MYEKSCRNFQGILLEREKVFEFRWYVIISLNFFMGKFENFLIFQGYKWNFLFRIW